MTHKFGGTWTEVKLDAVEYYLECYTKALNAVGMDLWYIDAFAGTADRQATREIGGLLESTPVREVTETLDGSVRRALKVSPGFDHLVFIEKQPDRCEKLGQVREEYPDRDIVVLNGDANDELCKLAKKPPWSIRKGSKSRGVVFLDPYALQVEWNTLRELAATKKLDVWYLFPLRDVVRQLAHKLSGVGPKEPKLDRVLSPAWRDLYELPEPEGPQLFDTPDLFEPPEPVRDASSDQIEAWFKDQLDKEFSFVSQPLPIMTTPGRQVFSLFLCVGNPSTKATELARKFVRYVNKNYGPSPTGVRRKSGR